MLFSQNETHARMELRRIELRAFRMQSEHSTTELQPLEYLNHQYFIDN